MNLSLTLLVEKEFLYIINSNSCTCSFVQIAGIEALKGPQDFVERMVAEFKRRRDAVVDGLNAIAGITCLKPAGAFYVFPNVKEIPVSCQVLADYLLEEAGVVLLAGTAFGKFGDGYLRISYANSLENIQEALERIQAVVSKLKDKSSLAIV